MIMRKMMYWVLAATFICGASVFTSCTNDSSDNPAPEQAKKDRKEFIRHTRENLKEVASSGNGLTPCRRYLPPKASTLRRHFHIILKLYILTT